MAFVFIGQVNVLAPIVTINFMLTYIAVDYSYFSVSMSYNIQQNSRKMQREDSRIVLGCSRPLILDKPSSYGSDGVAQGRSDGTLLEFTKDMDHLFRPLGKGPGISPEIKDKDVGPMAKQGKQKKAAKQTLQDSFLLDLDNNITSAQDQYDDVLDSHDKNMPSFSEPNHLDEDGSSLSPNRETMQKSMYDGSHHLHDMQKIPNQKVQGKKVRDTGKV